MLRDLFPTLCELAGLPVPDVDGRSQVPVLQGNRPSVYQHVVGYFRDSQRMIRSDHWKYIHYPKAGRHQLFDLQQDPFELRNLADDAEHQATRTALQQKLNAWLANASPDQP